MLKILSTSLKNPIRVLTNDDIKQCPYIDLLEHTPKNSELTKTRRNNLIESLLDIQKASQASSKIQKMSLKERQRLEIKAFKLNQLPAIFDNQKSKILFLNQTIIKIDKFITRTLDTELCDKLKTYRHLFAIPHTLGTIQFQSYQGEDLFTIIDHILNPITTFEDIKDLETKQLLSEKRYSNAIYPKLITLCESISTLHKLGYAYSDIKPENITRKLIDLDSISKLDSYSVVITTPGFRHPKLYELLLENEKAKKILDDQLLEEDIYNAYTCLFNITFEDIEKEFSNLDPSKIQAFQEALARKYQAYKYKQDFPKLTTTKSELERLNKKSTYYETFLRKITTKSFSCLNEQEKNSIINTFAHLHLANCDDKQKTYLKNYIKMKYDYYLNLLKSTPARQIHNYSQIKTKFNYYQILNSKLSSNQYEDLNKDEANLLFRILIKHNFEQFHPKNIKTVLIQTYLQIQQDIKNPDLPSLTHEEKIEAFSQLDFLSSYISKLNKPSVNCPPEYKRSIDTYATALSTVTALLCTISTPFMSDKIIINDLIGRILNNKQKMNIARFIYAEISKLPHLYEHPAIKTIHFILEKNLLSDEIMTHENSIKELLDTLKSSFQLTQQQTQAEDRKPEHIKPQQPKSKQYTLKTPYRSSKENLKSHNASTKTKQPPTHFFKI